MLDFHMHIARLKDPPALSAELVRCGYRANLVACEPWEWNATVPLMPLWKDSGRPCFGLHPMAIEAASDENFKILGALLARYPEAIVGECGLDRRLAEYAPGERQEAAFLRQASLARELGRTLMIHCVGDYRRIFPLLERAGFPCPNSPVILHRFGGDAETVRRAQPFHPIFSLHRDSFRKASTRNALSLVPEDQIRFETDADESFALAHPGIALAEALREALRDSAKKFKRTRTGKNEK